MNPIEEAEQLTDNFCLTRHHLAATLLAIFHGAEFEVASSYSSFDRGSIRGKSLQDALEQASYGHPIRVVKRTPKAPESQESPSKTVDTSITHVRELDGSLTVMDEGLPVSEELRRNLS